MVNQNTHIYIENLFKYVVSVIDYYISLFRRASRSNYAIMHTRLHNATVCFYRFFLGMEFSTGQYSVLILFSRFPYMALPSSLFLGMILSNHRSSNKYNIVQFHLDPSKNIKKVSMMCQILYAHIDL